MTVVGLRTVHELRGIPCLLLVPDPPARKHLTVSRTFGRPVEAFVELTAAVAFYTTRAGVKLRRHGLAASSMTVFASTDRFALGPQYANMVTLSLAPVTDSTLELLGVAQKGLTAVFRPGFSYRRAGVTLGGLVPTQAAPMRLWGDEQHERMKALMKAIDELNEKFGRDTVRCGLFPEAGRWRTRFSCRSPRYTTRWPEILTVGA